MKYFKYFFVLVFLFVVTSVAFADVTQFVFATDAQTVAPSTLSGVITIQSQDGTGTKTNISNTMYVTVTSSSPTGQFFSNTTGSVLASPVTMAKNSANKNFYYEDATAGTYTISVAVASVKGGPAIFSTSQQITVGSGSGVGTGSNGGNATTTTVTDGSNDSSSTAGAYSSSAPLSDSGGDIEFEVSAGRDRLTTVGSAIAFHAVVTKIQNASEQGITYTWSFGDGTTAQGSGITHTFAFPGDYKIILNAGYSDQSAVAIATVTVVVPNLSFARVDGGVQVGNNSNVDINLQGWNLVSPKKTFTFPTDTIISGGKKIIFANTVTGMDSAQIELVNPVGKSFGVLDADIVPLAPLVTTSVVQVATTSQMSLAEIQAKVSEVKAEFGLNTPAQKPRNIPSVAVITTPQVPTPSVSQDIQANDNQSAIAVEAFATSSQPSFVGSILSWPSRGFNFIKHLFVEQ